MNILQIVEQYGIYAMLTPDLLFILAIAAFYYNILTTAPRDRELQYRPVSPFRKSLFFAGLFGIYLGFGGPLNLLGHFSFSVHMLQQSIAYLIAPPLLLAGIPEWLYRWARRLTPLRIVISFLTKPLLAVFLFNGLFSVYHYPPVFDRIMSDYALHSFAHAVLLLTALCMWWPLVCPVKEWAVLSDLKKMGYIFLDGVLLTPACALIIFAKDPLYTLYTEGAGLLCMPFSYRAVNSAIIFNLLSPLEDQQLGGVLMKIMQEIVYGTALAFCFFKWFRREKETEALQEIGASR